MLKQSRFQRRRCRKPKRFSRLKKKNPPRLPPDGAAVWRAGLLRRQREGKRLLRKRLPNPSAPKRSRFLKRPAPISDTPPEPAENLVPASAAETEKEKQADSLPETPPETPPVMESVLEKPAVEAEEPQTEPETGSAFRTAIFRRTPPGGEDQRT